MLRETRQRTMEAWARGNYTTATADGTVQLNAQAIGELTMLDKTLDIIDSYKELQGGTEDIEMAH